MKRPCACTNWRSSAGKSVLLNFAHVAALRPDFGGRMRVTMSNGEVVVASRQYVPALKAKLGL